jgi:DNA-binding GntR family transcriptional regulator
MTTTNNAPVETPVKIEVLNARRLLEELAASNAAERPSTDRGVDLVRSHYQLRGFRSRAIGWQ